METRFTESTDEDEQPLEQRLWNISQASDRGRIRGYIDECELTDDDTIRVYVRLPNAEIHTETFCIPKTDSPKYAFVRLVEECGYSLASVGQLAGDDSTDGARVWCEPTDTGFNSSIETETHTDGHEDSSDDWQLVVPEYTPPFRERLHARLDTLDYWQVISTLAVAGGLLLLPLVFPFILIRVATDDELPDVILTSAIGVTALLIWTMVMWMLYSAVFVPGSGMAAAETLF